MISVDFDGPKFYRVFTKASYAGDENEGIEEVG
jgi:hypothetical protein